MIVMRALFLYNNLELRNAVFPVIASEAKQSLHLLLNPLRNKINERNAVILFQKPEK